MRIEKRRFRIGDLAKRLEIDKFVIRFWEKEFNSASDRSSGGQRFYEEADFEKFQKIKTLLYEKKFTIAGAKNELKNKPDNSQIIASQKTILHETNNEKFLKQIVALKKNLLKLRELL